MLQPTPITGILSAGANTLSLGTAVFSNSNNVSFGINGQTITASVSGAGGAFSAGVSTGGNTAGSTGVSGSRMVLVGSQNITLSQSTDANGLTVSISGGAGAAGNTGFISANATASLGTVVFSNSNGVSFGINGQTLTGSINSTSGAGTGFTTTATAGTAVAGTNNSAGLKLAVPAFITTWTVPTVTNSSLTMQAGASTLSSVSRIAFVDSNGVSFGASTSNNGSITITGTVKTDYLTAAVGLNTAQTNVTWTVNSSGISINAGGYAGTGFTTTATAGTAVVGTNNTAGLKLGVPAFITTWTVPTVTNSSLTMQAGASTLSSVSRIAFVDSNGVSFGASTSNNGSITITATVATSYLASNASTNYVQANAAFNGTNASGTISSNNISVSVAAQSNQTEGFYVTGNTTKDASSRTIDARTLSISAAGALSIGWDTAASQLVFSGGTAAVGSLSFYGLSNTTGTSSGTGAGTISMAGAGAISIAASNSGFVVSAPATSSLSATGIVSISTNGSTISIGAATFNAYATGNTTQNSSSNLDLRSVTIQATGPGLSVGYSNGSVVLSMAPHISYLNLAPMWVGTATTQFAQSTSYMVPFVVPEAISIGSVRMFEAGSCAASSTASTIGNTSWSMGGFTTHNFVFYSRGTGASSLSLQFVTSTQIADQCSFNLSAAGNSTQFSYSLRYSIGNTSFTKDYSLSAASLNFHTSNLTDLTGTKQVDYPCGVSLSGGQWFLGYGRSTTTSTGNGAVSVATRLNVSFDSQFVASQNTLVVGTLGSATNSSVNFGQMGLGSFSTGGEPAGTTASMNASVISSGASNQIPLMQLVRIA